MKHRTRVSSSTYKCLSEFKNWAIPGLFIFHFHLFNTFLVNKIADDWIRTWDLWCWKQLLYTLINPCIIKTPGFHSLALLGVNNLSSNLIYYYDSFIGSFYSGNLTRDLHSFCKPIYYHFNYGFPDHVQHKILHTFSKFYR